MKATTGGGIYYSLVSAALARRCSSGACGATALGARELQPSTRPRGAWQLGDERLAAAALAWDAHRLTDADGRAVRAARTDGIMPIVRQTARFNQHRNLIVSLFKHPPARRILFRRLTAWRAAAL